MNYYHLSLLVLISTQIAAMEQGAFLVQKPTLKTVPSLKEFALKVYAEILHENAPKEALSEAQLVDWGTEQGLDCFFDLNCGDLLPRLKQMLAEPTVIKTGLLCPNIFSSDGRSAFVYDYEKNQQYIVDAAQLSSVDYIDVRFQNDFMYYGLWPIFSPDAQWILGWEEGKKSTLIIHSTLNSSAVNRQIIRVPLANYQEDYTFLDAYTIVVRTRTDIVMSSIADFAAKGKDALTQVYCRNDMQGYKSSIWYRTIHALSDSSIACVGPDKRSIEILKRGADGLFFCAKIVAIPDISMGKLVVHNARGIAAMHVDPADKAIHLCQLLGDDAGKKSTINVEHFESYLFSPSGDYLACGPNYLRQVFEIFDCKNLASPQRIHVIQQAVDMGPAICIAWIERELVVRDGWGKKHVVTFNNAAPLLNAYTVYREKQEKEKETNKNAS